MVKSDKSFIQITLVKRDTRTNKYTCFFGPIPQKIINNKYFQYTSSKQYLFLGVGSLRRLQVPLTSPAVSSRVKSVGVMAPLLSCMVAWSAHQTYRHSLFHDRQVDLNWLTLNKYISNLHMQYALNSLQSTAFSICFRNYDSEIWSSPISAGFAWSWHVSSLLLT